MFWERFSFLCSQRGKSPTAVVNELELGRGSVTNWKNGKIPQPATLLKIANYFDVSIEYLKGEAEKNNNEGESENNVIVLHRNGKKIRRKITDELMDKMEKMIIDIPEEPKDI